MKTLHTALLASTFLCVTYVVVPGPARASSSWITQVGFIEASREEKQTNHATDVALDAASKGFPIHDEVDTMKTSVDLEDLNHFPVPDACVIQTQLAEELGDLYQRARDFRAHEVDVRQTQFQIVVGRYERAVLEIQERWKNDEMADEVALKAMFAMRADAFDYLQSLGVIEIRRRLDEAMSELIARGQDATDRANAIRDNFQKLYDLRLESAVAVFNARVASGNWTKQDWQRIEDTLSAIEKLALYGRPNDCGS